MPTKVMVSETDAINTVVRFVLEVIGMGGFILKTVYRKRDGLWIIQGEIKYVGDYTYMINYLSEVMNKSMQEFIDVLSNFILTKEVVESLKDLDLNKFYFYITPDGEKLCALNLSHFGEAIFSDKIYYIGEGDADAKDICKKAKELLLAGTTFRNLDFLPIIAKCDADKWNVLAIVSYYTRFDVIPKLYYFEYSRDGTFRSFKGY